MSITIRPERPADFPIIHELVRLAFEHAEHTDGDEPFLVTRLRQSPEYIPELALLAEKKGLMLGHIMYTKLHVGERTALALGPLAVLPEYHKQGIGSALIHHSHEVARSLGWEFVVLIGHAAYYPRFGYLPASSFGLVSTFEVPDEAFMAINLKGGPNHLPGLVEYSPAFFPETE